MAKTKIWAQNAANQRRKIGLPLVVLTMGLSLSACTLGSEHGYVPAPEEIAQIQLGYDNKSTIYERFGAPTVVGENENRWYYIASEEIYPGSLPTREVQRRVLQIDFNGAGTVVAVKETGLADGNAVAYNRAITPTKGRELNLWEQLVGGIGNFSAEDFIR